MKRLLPLLVLALGFHVPSPSIAQSSAPDGFAFVKNLGGIAEYTLSANGLSVLLLEDHSAPVLTFMVTYRVGSRNEVTGTTGATHLLEHMMFKGSKNFHPGIGKGFDTLMDKVGGINNATTWLDRTNYYENLPSDQLELAVQLEADRMRNLLLREEDRQPEMTVVRNEFERDENDPGSALEKEVNANAFIAHPYHHPTIGWRSDIERVPIEKLREFYDTFYWPNNATVTVIGDYKPDTALRLVKQYFGAIPRSPKPIPEVYTDEPAQTGPRRVIVKRPGEVGVVQIAYKVPPALHADHPALDVLAAVLSEGKTSRLYRALIDTNLAISADASKGFFHDQTLFNTNAVLAPGITHEQAEKTLLAEMEKVKKDGVTPSEVERAINKLLAGIAYRRDGSFAIAGQINESIAVGDWTYYLTLLEKLKAVTPADVHRVAKTYCNEDQSTTGWFIPQQESPGAAGAPPADSKKRSIAPGLTASGSHYYRDPADESLGSRAALHLAATKPLNVAGNVTRLNGSEPRNPSLVTSAATVTAAATGSRQTRMDGYGLDRSPLRERRGPQAASTAQAGGSPVGGDAKIAPNVRRRTVAGVDVVTLKTSIKDVITIVGVLNAGDVFNPRENSAIADLTAGMLDKGTVTRDKFALSELLEQVGATINFGTGSHTLNFTAKALRKDLPLVLGLLADQLRTPRFDPDEFAKLKQQMIGRHKRQMENTDFRAESTFARTIFPPGHPNRPPEDEKYLREIEAATIDQLKAFHAANYGPTGARLVAVGDVDDAAIDRTLTGAFAGWQGGRPLPTTSKVPALAAPRTERVSMPGKTSISFVMGQPSSLRYSDPNYQALNMATSVLGSGFFSARLLDIIRNREGLTYGIVAHLSADTYTDGAWAIHGTFAPELLDKGTASTWRELRRFHAEGLTAEELNTFKATLTGSYKVALSTTSGLASTLLNALQRGYGPEWVDEYPQRLQSLTLEQVNAAVKKFIDPEKMAVVLAGTLAPSEPAK